MTPPLDIVQWTAGIAVVLGALAKLVAVATRGSVSRKDSEAARIAAQWKRLDDVNDDLRADNDRLRSQLNAAYEETNRCRRELEECRAQMTRGPRRGATSG